MSSTRRLEHLWVSKLEPFALVPAAYASAAASLDYADLCYVAYGTNVLTEDKVEVGSYSELVLKVKRALERYLEAVGRTELSMAHLFDLVSHERAQRDGIRGGNLAELAALSLEVPARVIVYLVCELQGLEFWQEWGKLKDVVYHDEVMRPLVPAWLEEKRGEALRRPVEPVRTSQYLYDEGDLVGSLLVPRALKHARNYYVSDDDRLFWWDGTDEVIISPKCDAWLHKLARRYQEIMAEMEKADENVVADDADWPARDLVALFAELNEHYGRLYPFEGMYYEFLLNATKMPWRAAIALIREIGEEMHEKGSVIRHLCGSWDETGKKVTFNEGRVTMKRLYGAMANRRLRERYFGF